MYMIITFIGNCQTLSLCYFFQQLLKDNNNINYVKPLEGFRTNRKWCKKIKNIITDYNISIKIIKNSDYIIYQNINTSKSLFCNTNTLSSLKKDSCKLIQIPSIYLIYKDFNNSIKKLIEREKKNNVDIQVSDIFYKYKDNNLMITKNHPNTFLFLEVMKQICHLINVNFFTKKQCSIFLKNNNYMGLPHG